MYCLENETIYIYANRPKCKVSDESYCQYKMIVLIVLASLHTIIFISCIWAMTEEYYHKCSKCLMNKEEKMQICWIFEVVIVPTTNTNSPLLYLVMPIKSRTCTIFLVILIVGLVFMHFYSYHSHLQGRCHVCYLFIEVSMWVLCCLCSHLCHYITHKAVFGYC